MIKHFCSFVAGACVIALTVFPISAGDHITWLRWRVASILCAVLAVLALAVQAILQHNDDRKREEIDEKNRELLSAIAKGERMPLAEEPTVNADEISPTDRLRDAQEAVFVDESIHLSKYDFRCNLANDVEFRDRIESIPAGKYPTLDALRQSVFKMPLISARFVQSALVPRHPFAEMADELFKLMKKTPYERTSDFLFEIYLVNVSANVTTLQKITADAEVDGQWVPLRRLDCLDNYELVFDPDNEQKGVFTSPSARIETLDSLWEKVKDMRLERGVGFRGWAGFELKVPNTVLEKPVIHRVRLLDALGNEHSVVASPKDPPKEEGRIRHSRKAYKH